MRGEGTAGRGTCHSPELRAGPPAREQRAPGSHLAGQSPRGGPGAPPPDVTGGRGLRPGRSVLPRGPRGGSRGGAAALSHIGLTRPPLPGAEVTAARDGRPQLPAAPRVRRAAESRSGAGRGGAGREAPVLVRGPRAPGTRARRDCGAARPGLRRPYPAAAAAGGQRALGRWGSGPSSSAPSGPRPGRVLRGPGEPEGPAACAQGDADVGFLRGAGQAPGGLLAPHRPAPPAMGRNLKAGEEFSLRPASLVYRWRPSPAARSHTRSIGVNESGSGRLGGLVSTARVRPAGLEVLVDHGVCVCVGGCSYQQTPACLPQVLMSTRQQSLKAH